MDEEWEEETVEVRVANGTVVAMHRIRFAAINEVTLICRWCGQGVTARPDLVDPWMHVDGMITCRKSAMNPWVPTTVAAPTVWARGEDEEK